MIQIFSNEFFIQGKSIRVFFRDIIYEVNSDPSTASN